MRAFLTILAVAALFAAATAPAHAGPISTDLDISGSITLVSDDLEFTAGGGTGDSQSGEFGVRVGGSDTTSTYSGDTVTGAATRSTTRFTHTGDGILLSGSSLVTGGGSFYVPIDFAFEIVNNSLTSDWTVEFEVDLIKNLVDADPADSNVSTGLEWSAAESEFSVWDSDDEVFFSDLLSDPYVGDQVDGSDTDPLTYGDELSATATGTDTFTFSVLVGADSSVAFLDSYWTFSGFADENLAGMLAKGELDALVTIKSVSATVVPLPPAGWAGLLMLAGIAGLRRLRRRHA